MRLLFWVVLVVLLPFAAVAAEHHYSKEQLTIAIADLLMQQEGYERVRAHLIGDYPTILYRHTKPLKAELHVTDIQEGRGRALLSAQLKDVDGGEVGKRFHVEARFEEWVDLPVAVRRITGKSPITANDLTLAEFPKRRIERETFTDIEDLIGKAPRRSIPQGRPITQADIMNPLLVLKQDDVRILYRTPYIAIEAKGQALQDGAVGERISVRNLDSGKTLHGTVIAPNVVEISRSKIE